MNFQKHYIIMTEIPAIRYGRHKKRPVEKQPFLNSLNIFSKVALDQRVCQGKHLLRRYNFFSLWSIILIHIQY